MVCLLPGSPSLAAELHAKGGEEKEQNSQQLQNVASLRRSERRPSPRTAKHAINHIYTKKNLHYLMFHIFCTTSKHPSINRTHVRNCIPGIVSWATRQIAPPQRETKRMWAGQSYERTGSMYLRRLRRFYTVGSAIADCEPRWFGACEAPVISSHLLCIFGQSSLVSLQHAEKNLGLICPHYL